VVVRAELDPGRAAGVFQQPVTAGGPGPASGGLAVMCWTSAAASRSVSIGGAASA
jgi:hypothetical protein